MFFSIIIPTYNRADQLTLAIESVLRQKYQNFEIIIVDDGSVDHTREVVEGFKDHRILYFKKNNEERNLARNFGISKAQGDYISFLDSDDLLYPNHLSNANSLIESIVNAEVVHLNFEIANARLKTSLLNERSILKLDRELINQNVLHCNSIFIKKQIAKEFTFLPSKNAVVGEDHYLWLRLAARFKIHISLEVTNVINEHEYRSLNKIDATKLEIGTKEIHSSLRQDSAFMNHYSWRANRYFAYSYIFLALQFAIHKKTKKSIYYLVKATSIFPACLFSRRFIAVIKNIIT